MGINGIGATGYPPTGYMAGKAERNAGPENTGFMEVMAEEAARQETGYDEKAFEAVGANAPEEVKRAWMEAAKETGVNGLGMSGNGMLTHISQMMVQRLNRWMKGIGDTNDILGSTVTSAIRATGQALYDLDHPLAPGNSKSIEVQIQRVKERAFYRSFLDKLGALV